MIIFFFQTVKNPKDVQIPDNVLPLWNLLRKAMITRERTILKIQFYSTLEKISTDLSLDMLEAEYERLFKSSIHDREWDEAEYISGTTSPNIPYVIKEHLEIKWAQVSKHIAVLKQDLQETCQSDEYNFIIKVMDSIVDRIAFEEKSELRLKFQTILHRIKIEKDLKLGHGTVLK